jgi:GMP reductase
MRIEEDVKLDYKDVLIRPKRSTLGSRKEVDLTRGFTFRNYDLRNEDRNLTRHYHGIPIMAANMDGVGTFEMADTLAEQGMFTCLVKTYSVQELVSFFDTDDYLRTNHVAMSIGITDKDEMKFRDVYEQADSNLKYLCNAWRHACRTR